MLSIFFTTLLMDLIYRFFRLFMMEPVKDLNIDLRATFHKPKFPKVSHPRLLGFFSVDTNKVYQNNAQELCYLVPPEPSDYPLDLNIAGDRAKKKDEQAIVDIDHVLEYIMRNINKLMCGPPNTDLPPKLDADFVARRGVLRMIMGTPYEFSNNWIIVAIKLNGTIYLCEYKTPEDIAYRNNRPYRAAVMCSWGHKFEQYVTSHVPNKKPDASEPVDEVTEFNCVFSTNICNIRLLYPAEVDCVFSDRIVSESDLMNNVKLVEVKTRLGSFHPSKIQTYNRYKTLHWWCQSFLSGIDEIFVGLRDDDGLIHRTEVVNLNSLHKSGRGYWTPAICVDFLWRFLQEVQKVMINDTANTAREFYFLAKESRIENRIFENKNKYNFIPQHYYDFVKNLQRNS